MSGHKDKAFGDRLKTAKEAKDALLGKFRARPAADDPAVAEKQAARKAVSDAREARLAERKALASEQEAAQNAKAEREAAERIAHEAAEQEQKDREAAERVERESTLKAERKAARDARYAARKARK